MKKPLGAYTAKEIMKLETKTLINGFWVPARPLQFWSISRIKQAWHVLTMKADALYWEEDIL